MNIGGGANYWLSDTLGLRFELRDHLPVIDGGVRDVTCGACESGLHGAGSRAGATSSKASSNGWRQQFSATSRCDSSNGARDHAGHCPRVDPGYVRGATPRTQRRRKAPAGRGPGALAQRVLSRCWYL